ncbi:MAG: hypothetical protein M5T61_15010 [Acidimicrobiia bacterium]|nr:hypothetical protein [Acidimicrobiia bacterium]
MEMRRYRRVMATAAVAVAVAIGGAACGGGDSDDGGGGGSSDAVIGADDVDVELDVDNCTLLTDAEVSALAGETLEATGDTPLGCGWVVPDETIADFTLNSFRSGDSVQDRAADLAPSAEVLEMDGVGDAAVALAVDGSVNFVVAKQGDLGVVLVTTFLDITPDSPELEAAGEIARTALANLAESA